MTPADQTSGRPTVLFVCVHNAGRSQLAAGLAHHHAAGAVEVLSAGTDPDDRVDLVVLAALAELGIDRSEQVPTRLTPDLIDRADVLVALKPGLQLPQQPRGRHENWPLPEPRSWTLEGIRPLRDHLDGRVRQLLDQLSVPGRTAGRLDDAAPAGYPQLLHSDAPLITGLTLTPPHEETR